MAGFDLHLLIKAVFPLICYGFLSGVGSLISLFLAGTTTQH